MKPIFVGAILLSFFMVTPVTASPTMDNFFNKDYTYKSEVKKETSKKETKKKTKYNKKAKKEVVRGTTGSGDLISRAMSYVGSTASQLGLPVRLWCADFMNMLVGGKDRRAISFMSRGSPASYGCTNCVAVTRRKGGGHVGIVKGYDTKGNPILISGNHSRRVGVGTYSRNSVIAYRYL
jgi:uncharacterized protein (TIGR02594 family)